MRKKQKSRKGKFLKIFIMFLLIVVCLGVAGWTYMCSYMAGFTKKNTVASGDAVKPKEVKVTDPVNILFMGTDIGDPKADPANNKQRTDTMMIIHYNPKDDKMNIVSIPRDTKVRLNGKTAKINSANAIGGAQKAIDAVESLLNININYYARVDYTGFNELIDAIGGIDMPIKYNMQYDDAAQNLHIHFKKGTTVHLDGKKAEEFFRWRKNNKGVSGGLPTGDIGRIENQHLFMEKLIEKVKSFSIITKIPSLLEVAQKNIYTNMDGDNILNYGLKFAKLGNENIKMSTLEGSTPTIDGVSYFVYDKQKNKDIISTLRFEDKTNVSEEGKSTNDSESESEDDTSSSSNVRDVKIQVLNGTSTSGLASKYKTYLQKQGYKNIVVGNGTKTSTSKIIVNNSDINIGSDLKNEFGIYTVKHYNKKEAPYDIVIILGKNYIQKN